MNVTRKAFRTKIIHSISATGMAVALSLTSALAQSNSVGQGNIGSPGGVASPNPALPMGQPRSGQAPIVPNQGSALPQGQSSAAFRASQLIGRPATSPQGLYLGRLQDIVFYPDIGAVGVLAMSNGRLVPVPWNLLTTSNPRGLVINTTPQALVRAPMIAGTQWTNFSSQFYQEIQSYYGVGLTNSGGQVPGVVGQGGALPPTQQSQMSGFGGPQAGPRQFTNYPYNRPSIGQPVGPQQPRINPPAGTTGTAVGTGGTGVGTTAIPAGTGGTGAGTTGTGTGTGAGAGGTGGGGSGGK